MKLGIFSDVHSNLEALQAVIEAFKGEGIDKYIFLGDAVGYGANPNECCHLIKKLADYAILGNHDAACCKKLSYLWFNPVAQKAINWSQQQLSQENQQWLESLDYTLEFQGFLMSHGLPLKPEAFEYDDNIANVRLCFNKLGNRFPLFFIGHSHRPLVFIMQNSKKGNVVLENKGHLHINRDNNYLINVGSVGQPRDGNPLACYTIFNTEEGVITSRRIEYNIEKAGQKIRNAHLPPVLAERLMLGY